MKKSSGFYLDFKEGGQLYFRNSCKDDRRKTVIGYSKVDANWHESLKGKPAAIVTEDGDGNVKIKLPRCGNIDSKVTKKLELNLCDAAYLRVALNELARSNKNMFSKYIRVVKK